jgi:hypothetical protein
LFNGPKSFVFKLHRYMTCFSINHPIRWHSYRWFVSTLISLKCITKSQTPILSIRLHCLLQNRLNLKFQLGHSLEGGRLRKSNKSHGIYKVMLPLNDCKNECHDH